MFSRKHLNELLMILFLFPPRAILADGTQDMLRAVHMGGNWGSNTLNVLNPPSEYFDLLDNLRVNWVGISVALHVDDSMDSTVERKYSDVGIPTFADEDLVRAIRSLKENGFQVYLTLAFELDAQLVHPVQRWQLGDPKMPDEDPNVQPEFWPWALEHPLHEQFVREFWRTYTEQALYYASLCEREGVAMFSLGTETERIFRTRAGGYWPNHFGDELKAMVDTVRTAYSGLLTYDMHYGALVGDFSSPGSDHLWEDLELDIVGISAWFPLVDFAPTEPLSEDSLRTRWNEVFDDYLQPLKARNPNLPIVFLEFGYNDVVAAPFDPVSSSFIQRVFGDANNNGVDDGEETQANCLSAFFSVNSLRNNLINGTFLWDNFMASNQEWANSFGKLRSTSIRSKMSEDIVRQYYAQQVALKGDIDMNRCVGFDDFILFSESFGKCQGHQSFNPKCDLNGDRCADFEDFLIFSGNYGKCEDDL